MEAHKNFEGNHSELTGKISNVIARRVEVRSIEIPTKQSPTPLYKLILGEIASPFRLAMTDITRNQALIFV